jgi:hypothetical protein
MYYISFTPSFPVAFPMGKKCVMPLPQCYLCESAGRATALAAADVHLGLNNVFVFFEIFAVKFRLSGHPVHPACRAEASRMRACPA